MRGIALITLAVLAVAPAAEALTAQEVYAAFRALAQRELWPDFSPAAVPVAIYDGAQTWLFNHPAPPAGFELTDRCDGCRVYDGQHTQVKANTSTEIGGTAVGTYLLPESSRRTAEDHASIIVHETFHVHQNERYPDWTADEGALMTYPMTDAGLLAQRRYETEAFRRALEAETAEDAAAWAAAALQLRQARFADLVEEGRTYERGIELREGLAQYVERRAIDRLGDTGLPENGFAPEAVRGRGYETGQALAVLLDRFRPSWQRELDADPPRPLDEMLEAALRAIEPTPAALSVDERHRMRLRAERDARSLIEERGRARDDFLARPGWTVRVVVGAEAEPLWPSGFDPMNLAVIGDGTLLHTRWLMLGNGAGRIEVSNRAALTVPAGEHPLFHGVREVLVTGLSAEPEILGGDDWDLRLAADGVSAHFSGVTVKTTGRELHVTVR